MIRNADQQREFRVVNHTRELEEINRMLKQEINERHYADKPPASAEYCGHFFLTHHFLFPILTPNKKADAYQYTMLRALMQEKPQLLTGQSARRTIHTFLALAMVAATLILSPSAQGADIRLGNGVRLHYETTGSGNLPVVLVHGYGMSSVVWEKALPLFPSGYRWLAVDLRGFGRSDKPESGYSCPELADDIAAFLDALGLSQAVLIGHSFGGLVVQHFAVRYPQRVLALVLADTFAATLPPKGLAPAVKQRINGYGSAEENRKVFSATMPRYFDAANVSREDLERFVEVGLQAGNTALRETLKANYTTPAIPASKHTAVRAPVLILMATHDPFGTFDQAVAMSDALPNSRIQVIARSGHTPMWERPSDFARAVGEFLMTSCLR